MKLHPSLMCINWENIKEELEQMNAVDIYGYHIDVMDGHFVPTFGLGPQDISAVKNLTNKEIDIHLMCETPENYIDLFANVGATMIAFHVEATNNVGNALMKIKEKGIKAGIAINPATPLNQILPIIDELDYVIIMTVNPGFAGQKYLSYVNKKIEKLVRLKNKEKLNLDIYVDGAISKDRIKILAAIGVEGFVLGTSTLFGKGESYKKIIKSIIG
jgi:Pentose-5-phosphate-3-epimerase